MSISETTEQPARPDEPEIDPSLLADMDVPPMIQKALDQHRRDLPELMKTHYRQRVIYHGDKRLEFGRSQSKLYQKYLARGYSMDELMVLGVEPMIEDEPELDPPNPPDEPALEMSSIADTEVPPMIQRALDKHRRDLPELMKTHAYQWVIYHGEKRLEFGRSQQKLYQKYLARGLTMDELVVFGVEPQLPDEVELDSSEWAHV